MIDLRYLGLTLIAVFLALAIGLMTGSALGSPEKQAAVYDGLKVQFEELRVQNQEVRDESDDVRRRLTARDRAMRELLPLAVRGKLPGSTIGVILCGKVDERPFWSDLENAIVLAGAKIGPMVRIPDQPRMMTSEDRARFEGYWRKPGEAPAERNRLDVAGWALLALTRPGQEPRLRELARATEMELRGDFSNPVRRILVLTAVPDELRSELVKAGDTPEKWVVDAAAAETGVRLVAAEPEETETSALEPLRSRNIVTVDNIDTAAGQISAVLGLAGSDGHFGSKPGATRPLPALEP